jgi:hypothetical protein
MFRAFPAPPSQTPPPWNGWASDTSNVQWCEAVTHLYALHPCCAELANTVTNVCAFTAAMVGIRRVLVRGLPASFLFTELTLAVVAIGSTIFHATRSYYGEMLDELPMSVMGVGYLLVLKDRFAHLSFALLSCLELCFKQADFPNHVACARASRLLREHYLAIIMTMLFCQTLDHKRSLLEAVFHHLCWVCCACLGWLSQVQLVRSLRSLLHAPGVAVCVVISGHFLRVFSAFLEHIYSCGCARRWTGYPRSSHFADGGPCAPSQLLDNVPRMHPLWEDSVGGSRFLFLQDPVPVLLLAARAGGV